MGNLEKFYIIVCYAARLCLGRPRDECAVARARSIRASVVVASTTGHSIPESRHNSGFDQLFQVTGVLRNARTLFDNNQEYSRIMVRNSAVIIVHYIPDVIVLVLLSCVNTMLTLKSYIKVLIPSCNSIFKCCFVSVVLETTFIIIIFLFWIKITPWFVDNMLVKHILV